MDGAPTDGTELNGGGIVVSYGFNDSNCRLRLDDLTSAPKTVSAVRIVDVSLWRAELRTRMPFKYGIATMTELPHVFVQVRCEFDLGASIGIAADHLPPKWFTKDPQKDPRLEVEEMLAVIRQARAFALETKGASVFAWWRELRARQQAWAKDHRIPSLLAQFGVSLLERAVIDAWCRRRETPFARALHEDAFGIELGSVHTELANTSPSNWLPSTPPNRIHVRHTVGLSDPLRERDITPEERLDDGLPQSLEASIGAYGLRHFKIKISGPGDLPRLREISDVIVRCVADGWRGTLDGNESFRSLEAFRSCWEELVSDRRLEPLRRGLWFVEQPFHRDVALTDEMSGLAQWAERPPIIIDESDADLDSLPRALDLGYAGTSHKNCKGVFKGIANACLIAQRERVEPARPWRSSGEDLSNIGPIALLQDLAVQAALGITSVERNGHHYFAGLSPWPAEVGAAMLAAHDDLYEASARGWPTVRIRSGAVDIQSVLQAPFGVGPQIEAAATGAVLL